MSAVDTMLTVIATIAMVKAIMTMALFGEVQAGITARISMMNHPIGAIVEITIGVVVDMVGDTMVDMAGVEDTVADITAVDIAAADIVAVTAAVVTVNRIQGERSSFLPILF
jgi:hypothetical protein